jgi:hypothetical protein
MQGLARRNTHVKYEILPPTNQKLWPRLKFWKIRPNSKVRGSKWWYQMNGLARRNTHVKYESPTTHQSKVMTKVKVLEKKVKGQVHSHSLPLAHTFTSVNGSLNVWDYFRFNTIAKWLFSLNNLRKCFLVLVLRITYLSFTYILYVVYVYLQIIWRAHYSHKNSAPALIHYLEIPAVMWVSSGANLSR